MHPSGRPVLPGGRAPDDIRWQDGEMELPDFHIPHAEKIEWMIETRGWALEAVPADSDSQPPSPPYAYTIGFPPAFGFPDVVVFGLTPAATNGMLGLVADLLAGGTEIPLDVALTGLFDNDLRCVFSPVDTVAWAPLFTTARAWYRTDEIDMVQLLWPDRNGFLPFEVGFEQRLRYAQPVVGRASDGE
jgi:hypothetical protein